MHFIRVKESSKTIQVGKIVCVGRNYADHAKELGNEVPDKPVIFLKPASAMIQSGEKVIHPSFTENLHHEIELVLLIGKTVKNADDTLSEDAIAGYGVGLDMTLRDIQKEAMNTGNPWTVSKCFDTSAVVSDFVLKENFNLSLDETISLTVNGQVKQNEKLNKLLHGPAALVKYISSLITLEEGDLIFTGTPAGVSRVVPGDILHGEIEGMAVVETEIIAE